MCNGVNHFVKTHLPKWLTKVTRARILAVDVDTSAGLARLAPMEGRAMSRRAKRAKAIMTSSDTTPPQTPAGYKVVYDERLHVFYPLRTAIGRGHAEPGWDYITHPGRNGHACFEIEHEAIRFCIAERQYALDVSGNAPEPAETQREDSRCFDCGYMGCDDTDHAGHWTFHDDEDGHEITCTCDCHAPEPVETCALDDCDEPAAYTCVCCGRRVCWWDFSAKTENEPGVCHQCLEECAGGMACKVGR